jgi:hypothetical protein
MTTSQIILWIARTFPSHKAGEGKWEKNIQAALSRFEEFDGVKIPGAQGSKKIWCFSSPALKTQYERQYPEFCVASESHRRPLKGPWQTVVDDSEHKSKQRSKGIARKSAPSMPQPISAMQANHIVASKSRAPTATPVEESAASRPQLPSIPKQLDSSPGGPKRNSIVETKQSEERMEFMPFQRTTPRQHVPTLDTIMNATKESSFHDICALRPDLRSIDTMTQAEKAQKIAQIKSRPSRKKYFGSDYHLAHKRRHDLADIHDESDGAWIPPRFAMKEQHARRDQADGMGLDEEGTRSLREVFNLPENVLPMNDGHTELAFRDGTLVSHHGAIE